MLLIGETLNSSSPTVHQALAGGDRGWVEACVRRQAAAGVDLLDLCAASFAGAEAEVLQWLAERVEPAADLPLCLDSGDPAVLARVGEGRRHPPLLNSLGVDGPWPEGLLDLVRRGDARLVLQLRRGRRLPRDAEERVAWATEAVARARAARLEEDRLFLDGVLLPWKEDRRAGEGLRDFLRRARRLWPAATTLVGLSNVSWGVEGRPERRRLHALWLEDLKEAGLGACLLDPLDADLVARARA